ncbi:MAG: vWA domain-containing protein [Acidobacteriota bacterium]
MLHSRTACRPSFRLGGTLPHTVALTLGLVLWLVAASPGTAEICWAYTDNVNAKVPLKCVQMGDPTLPCSWSTGGETCNTDFNPSDCCMAVHDPGATQTIGEMHVAWHDCLGNVGTAASPPPPNRGLRWYAFHRQLEWDFNEYREGVALPKLESLEWCPGMNMPHGHFGAGIVGHPLGCGTGTNRPDNVNCTTCVPFVKCLYLDGAGGATCSAPPTPTCSTGVGGVTFPYTQLTDFPNVDEVATLLDDYFHGQMHGAVAFADGSGYTNDCQNPNCSTRDGMFWRLHKALDDVVRAWQEQNAVDVTLVIDRSGSMGAASGTGVGTRLENAVEAADMFADLLEEGRTDGQTNRLGIVSYSSNASNPALNMPLTNVDATLRDPGGPFVTTLNALSPGGLTSIGSGIVGAIDQLCPGGTCNGYVPAVGENGRKGILLLTDGQENRPPCLEANCDGVGGAEIDYTTLDFTQLCAVGLGSPAAIDGDLLTILAERQGGIFMNDTDSTGTDLKDFFTKCFATLTDEFIGLDPNGVMTATQAAGPLIPYESCDEERITFTGGWKPSVLPGDKLQLLVTSPLGDAWTLLPGWGEMNTENTWAFKRAPLPYLGQAEGTWTLQLVRPQRTFVNGFASDAFADVDQGTRLVRRQIQRLCPADPSGEPTCRNVLLFEDGVDAESAYERALDAESGITVGQVTTVGNSAELATQLVHGQWDLVVYARQVGSDKKEPYDDALIEHVCSGQRAILTDTRTVGAVDQLFACANVERVPGPVDFTLFDPSADWPFATLQLSDPGRGGFSYALRPAGSSSSGTLAVQDATFQTATGGGFGAVVGTVLAGSELNWHANVLVKGLTRLSPFLPFTTPQTGKPLQAAVRIMAPYQRAGGYPGGVMTVEVERPMVSLADWMRQNPVPTSPDDPRYGQEIPKQIPTVKEVFALNDDGREGDLYPKNGTFSAKLPISAAVDGLYTLHYRFDYPVDSCMARRELKQTVFVGVDVQAASSRLELVRKRALSEGRTEVLVELDPRDVLGNRPRSNRRPAVRCTAPCACAADAVTRDADGVVRVPVQVPAGLEVGACTLEAFGTSFPLGLARAGR